MTQFYNVGGVDVPANTVRLVGGLEGLTSAADGSVAEAQCAVDDPTGSLTFLSMATFKFTETACSQPRCFTGFIHNVKVSRGPYLTGPGRVWTFDIWDLNNLLHQRVLRGSGADRPGETANARLTWLLASVGLAGLVYDNGLIGSNTNPYDAADYRGKYPDEVLQDICLASGGTPWIFFVYWDNSAQQASLFFNNPAVALRDSTLTISNVNADLSATCFAPIGPELSGTGEDVYDGLYFIYKGTPLYRQRAATFTAFGIHRDAVFETDRVGSAATASAHADIWLLLHSGQIDTINCTIQVPAASVNLLDAGMRVQVKFSHLPGYTSFTWTRVTRRTILLADQTNEYYLLQLELSVRGINQAGGGNPGAFPAPPGCTAASVGIVQSATAGATNVVLPATPIVGNTLLWLVAGRTSGTYVPPTGTWTQLGPTETCNRNVVGDYPIKIYSKPVEVTDTATFTLTPNITAGSRGFLVEIQGTPTYDVGDGASVIYGVNATVSITPTAGKVALLVSLADLATDSSAYTPPWSTPATGMTELFDTGPLAPQVGINYQVVASTSGSYTVGSTGNINGTGDTAAVIGIALYCTGTDNPPMPGQWVGINPPEYVVMSGVNGTTAFAFADGSLRVFYDNVEQTAAIVSYDGAAKTFVMAGAPLPGWQVRVEYQGR